MRDRKKKKKRYERGKRQRKLKEKTFKDERKIGRTNKRNK